MHFIEQGKKHQQQQQLHLQDAPASASSSSSSSVSSLPLPLRDEAGRYALYHCHHMLTSFRAERKQWALHDGQRLSRAELTRVMDYTFFAGVLLHLTGLYEAADKYCEDLLGVMLSCTIFLSVAAHDLRSEIVVCDHDDDVGGSTAVDGWDSLHWATVHYCAGVTAWGLLDHKEPLLRVQRTAAPFRRIAQTLSIVTREALACAAEAHEPELPPQAVEKEELENEEKEKEETEEEDTEQQWQLQLLPLVWIAFLARRGGPSRRASRHALRRAVPIFRLRRRHRCAAPFFRLALATHVTPPPRSSDVEIAALLSLAESNESNESNGAAVVVGPALLCAWQKGGTDTDEAPAAQRPRGAYAAFCAIPRGPLTCEWSARMRERADGNSAEGGGGAAFVRALLLRALQQWAARHARRPPVIRAEGRELLRAARHVAALRATAREAIDTKIGPRADIGTRADMDNMAAVAVAADAALRAFAARAADIVIMDSGSENKAALAEFDALMEATLRKESAVPRVYE